MTDEEIAELVRLAGALPPEAAQALLELLRAFVPDADGHDAAPGVAGASFALI
ncbi:hypothetical protein [Caenispirillum salinarum]|uniref:hypothetical protein n=1 Tax=Caenispirillum salinarum TaxID=859058 RepID=UPI00384D3F51